ncbi:MAG: AAA family ATPase [Christensenellaceae bacterium]|jgi:guanylate kinase|nr:AAA family ATPase [Christensenellaceae bacterium]
MLIAIEGPAGSGKDFYIKKLIEKYPNGLAKAASFTTRGMRGHESEGNPYYFVNDIEFDEMVGTGDIFEYTTTHGSKRGMSEKFIREITDKGKIAIKDCDIVGLRALIKKFGKENVRSIFIYADKEETARRMRKRGDKEEEIKKRLLEYERYMGDSKYFDYIVKDEGDEETIERLEKIILNGLNKPNIV